MIIIIITHVVICILGVVMKKNIHPDYQKTIFHDSTADIYFLVGSTIKTNQTIEYENQTYPYVRLDISSASHPFYTGKGSTVKQEGRMAKFQQKFGSLGSKKRRL